jgi:hypothetical protein
MADMPRTYDQEIFCADDGGTGPFWVTAEHRLAIDAAQTVNSVVTLEDDFSVSLVSGRIEDTPDGAKFMLDEDGPIEMWEIDA